jgi:OmpA-OmpF porin, OOP family
MQNKMIKIAIAATLGLTSIGAAAEDMYRGAWYAVPGVSYMDTDNDLEADNGRGGFLSIGKEINPNWDLQARLGHNRANEDTGIAGVGGKYKQTTLGLDALYMFSRDKFRPFLLAGVGVARNNVDYSNAGLSDKKETSWMASLGLGAQYLITEQFGLQADVRHQWSRAQAKNAAGTIDADGTIGNTIASLGAILRFGAPEPVVAEAAPEPAPIAAAPEPMPEPAPAPAPLAAVEPCKPKFETITLEAEKLFGFDKTALQTGAKPLLDDVVAKLKEHEEFKLVMVTGHTDRIGTVAYNQKLSEQRANEVKDYLVSQGVSASRLQAIGKGESEPVVDCKGVRGKQLIQCLAPNRRVVILDQEQHQVEGQTCN